MINSRLRNLNTNPKLFTQEHKKENVKSNEQIITVLFTLTIEYYYRITDQKILSDISLEPEVLFDILPPGF